MVPNRRTPLAKPCPAMVDRASGGATSRIVDGGGILLAMGGLAGWVVCSLLVVF